MREWDRVSAAQGCGRVVSHPKCKFEATAESLHPLVVVGLLGFGGVCLFCYV